MKLFGRELFNRDQVMYDFAGFGLLNIGASTDELRILNEYVAEMGVDGLPKAKKKKVEPSAPALSPKEVYETKTLNDNNFKINIDADYIKTTIADIDERLSLFAGKKTDIEFGGAKYAKRELISIRERLKNRLKLKDFTSVIEEFPHTSTKLIADVLVAHSNLRCEKATDFIPDFPTEAIQSMKKYDEMCKKLCGKTTNFYVIADKKDFGVKNQRRDPILLAQSPFGFFWQILGAWDKEMIYLGDL